MLPYAIVITSGLIGIRVLSSRLKLFQKITLNAALGLLAMYFFNLAGEQMGVVIGLNMFSGVIMGLCGPIGLVVLLVLRFFNL